MLILSKLIHMLNTTPITVPKEFLVNMDKFVLKLTQEWGGIRKNIII